jgi:hypothetical protein
MRPLQDSKVINFIQSSLCLPEKDVSLRPCQETQPLCRINLFIVTKDKLLNIFWKGIQIESIDSFFLGLWKLVAGAFIELARSISRFIQTLKSRTGRSLFEPLILTLRKPQNDKRLFIDLQLFGTWDYKLRTCCVHKLLWMSKQKTIYLHKMFWACNFHVLNS